MKTVVLLSGGIDSTVLLGERLGAGDECHAVTFNYGQLAYWREVNAAAAVSEHYRLPSHRVIEIPAVFGVSALTGQAEMPASAAQEPDASTVPARNLVFVALGVAVAESINADCVMFGATLDDAAGYIDCRPGFIHAVSEAAYQGTRNRIAVAAPYHYLPKRAVVEIGRARGVPFDLTWSCYRGDTNPCEECGACQSNREATA